MIAGIFHQGSGLGNQLHRYVMTRVLALDKGFAWGMGNPENFKGSSFMSLDMGLTPPNGDIFSHRFEEKKIVENGVDIRGYDPEVNFINDGTLLDGEFQDERYFAHRLNEIDEWLKVKPLDMPADICVINFRGGEYTAFPDLFLTKAYWDEAIALLNEKYDLLAPDTLEYEVHTDDPYMAKRFFPDYRIVSDIGLNWRSIRYAKHLIISNSSFAILPALLNQNAKEVIAPRFWARRNTGVWALPQNYYKKFTYI